MTDPVRPRVSVDAGRLWGGGVATGLVAAIVAVVGVLVCSIADVRLVRPALLLDFFHTFAGDYALTAFVLTLVATGVAHLMAKNNDESKFPKIFYVNWFRRDEDGGFLWPGFGENSRILKYVIERVEGKVEAVETPIGLVPVAGAIDTDGLDVTEEQLEKALRVDVDEWKAEIPQINEWFEKFGDKLPTVLWTELDGLKARLEG